MAVVPPNSTDPSPFDSQMDLQEDNDGVSLTHVSSDYIQCILYAIFILIGLPVNMNTLIYMLRRYRHAKSLLLLLHINLNISNILVLIFFCTGFISWMITYEWRGGAVLCLAMRFMDEFVFSIKYLSQLELMTFCELHGGNGNPIVRFAHVSWTIIRLPFGFSSNVMVCIAVYRLYALRCPVMVNTVGRQRIPRMLLSAWIISAVVSMPQLFVWKQATLHSVTQCLTIWTEKLLLGTSSPRDEVLMKLYNAFHLLVIFYIPLVILVVCYCLILHDIYETLNQNVETSSVVYWAETTRFSSIRSGKKSGKSPKSPLVSAQTRTLRGQERLRRAKVKSLRITLLLILSYVVTWLPYNFLSWWLMVSTESYRSLEDVVYFLNCLVVLNSVINPFIYGRCTGLKMFSGCAEDEDKKRKKCSRMCWAF